MRNRWNAGFAALVLLLLLAIGAAPASAGLYAFGGYETESEDMFAGAGYQLALGPITASPNIEYLFVDEGKVYTINLDGHLNLIPLGIATLWAGAGMAIRTVDPDNFDSETNTGGSLLLGANFNATRFKPFAQIRQVFIEGDDPFSVAFGIHF
jgi:hypothetical protein